MEILTYSIISWIFILITLIVYIILWRRHSLHGWMQFAFLISAFFYFLILFVRKVFRNRHGQQNPSQAIERFYTFFTLAHCTNIVNLSFHMFLTFLKVEPEFPIRKLADLKPLFKTLALCWTFPAVITIIELFVNDGTGRLLEQGVLVALISLNCVIIIITVILIIQLVRDSRKVPSASTSFELKSMTFLFLRLFCITGLIWTVKAIPLLVVQTEAGRTNGFWTFMNFLSDSYGVVIFFVFIYNQRVLSALKDYPALRKIFLPNCFKSKGNIESKQFVIPRRTHFRTTIIQTSPLRSA